MSNQFGYACPRCGVSDDIRVAARTWCVLLPNGSEAIGDHEWNADSDAMCGACNWHGTASEFAHRKAAESGQ